MPTLNRSLVLAALLVLGFAIVVEAQRPDRYPDRPNNRGQAATAPEGTGTVAYDPGVPADSVVVLTGSVNLYGNLFNTRNSLPLSSGVVTRVSWYTGSVGGFAPVWFATPGGTATYLGCCSATSANAFNSAALALAVPSSFFLGLDVGGSGAFGSLGLRSATTNSQGFHGRQRYSGAGASNTLSGQNMMVRVSGDIVIPVELLDFNVE